MSDVQTHNYRHGVLMGNWNEDAFGVQLVRSDPIRQPVTDDRLRGVTHATYTANGREEVYESIANSQIHPRAPAPLSSELLFSHDARAQRPWVSEYSLNFGEREDDHALERYKVEMEKRRSKEEEEGRGRERSYRTTASDAFSVRHSVLALATDATPATLRFAMNAGLSDTRHHYAHTATLPSSLATTASLAEKAALAAAGARSNGSNSRTSSPKHVGEVGSLSATSVLPSSSSSAAAASASTSSFSAVPTTTNAFNTHAKKSSGLGMPAQVLRLQLRR